MMNSETRDLESKQFDTIIVGAGPAGCVLARRLSESDQRQILLLDAGTDYGPNPADWPTELLDPAGPVIDEYSWGYRHRSDANGREIQLPRGRVFGGCSSVNSCIWLHGSKVDYDEWARLGNAGWDYANLQPFFDAAESDPLRPPLQPGDQCVDVWRTPPDALSAIDRAIMESASELGMMEVRDLNASAIQSPCVGPTPKNLRDGTRLNAALSFLANARRRNNLTLLGDTLVDRVMFTGSRATGVLTADGIALRAHDIIIAAGAYGSPAILLRSGVGPVEHLRELGIPVIADVPGVGQNLMDHPYLAPYTSGRTSFLIKESTSPSRRSFIQTMIKARSRQVDEEIDLHLYPRELPLGDTGQWVLGFGISLQYARSRGRLLLTSRDPHATLDIDHRYFDDPLDLEALTDGVELLDRLVATRPLADLLQNPVEPDKQHITRATIQQIIRDEVGTTFHPSSTCKMGPQSDPMAVVSTEGRVRGTSALRVIDASIFPTGPRCNLHAPAVAVAGRMAALIARSSNTR